MTRTVAGGPRARVAAHGLAVTLPERWEARLYVRDRPDLGADPAADPAERVRGGVHPAAYGHPGESMNPVLHLANFALPPGRGDFGTGAVERMGADHAFVAVLEFDTDEAGRALYAARGIPRLALCDFVPNALQRRLPGHLGCQRFFTERERPFCLYVVLGSRRHADALVAEVQDVLDHLEIAERTTR